MEDSVLIGTIVEYAGQTINDSLWKLCDGSQLLKTDYPELFAKIGYTYSVNSSGDYFNLPDTRGKVIVGYKSGHAIFGTFANTVGEDSHTLTVDELPSHSHTVALVNSSLDDTSTGYKPTFDYNKAATANTTTQATGAGQSHNNIQTSLVCNYIIKVKSAVINLPTVKFNGTVSQIENTSNKVTEITENSTDVQYPTAKAVYDYIQTLLSNN